MREIVKYKTFTAEMPKDLDELVNESIPKGWQPYGPRCVAITSILSIPSTAASSLSTRRRPFRGIVHSRTSLDSQNSTHLPY